MPITDWKLEPREQWKMYLDKGDTRFWFAGFGPEGERRWVKNANDAMTFPDKETMSEMYDAINLPDLASCTTL